MSFGHERLRAASFREALRKLSNTPGTDGRKPTLPSLVIPAKAEIQCWNGRRMLAIRHWTPAFALTLTHKP